MNEPADHKGLFSRLPDDQTYWHGLTDRIVDDAAARLEEYGGSVTAWWSGIAGYSALLAVGAAAAVIAAFALFTVDGEASSASSTTDVYGLIPPDPLAVALISREAPPKMETLLVVRYPEYER